MIVVYNNILQLVAQKDAKERYYDYVAENPMMIEFEYKICKNVVKLQHHVVILQHPPRDQLGAFGTHIFSKGELWCKSAK